MNKVIGVLLCICMLVGMLAGCGKKEGNVVDTATENLQSQMSENEDLQTEDLQTEIIETEGETNTQVATEIEETESESRTEQETQRPSESESVKPDESTDSQKPDSQKPDSQKPDSQKPDSQKPDSQKPDSQKPETQKPETQEPETQEPETQEPETQEPEPQEPEKIEYQLSSQTYPFAKQLTEKTYVVWNDAEFSDLSGKIVDFNGNVIAEFNVLGTIFDVGEGMVKITHDIYERYTTYYSSIYDVKTGEKVVEYLNIEFLEPEEDTIVERNGQSYVISDVLTYYDDLIEFETPKSEHRRDYFYGMFEELKAVEITIGESTKTYYERTYINAKTEEIIYTGYEYMGSYFSSQNHFSLDKMESRAVFIETDVITGELYLVLIEPDCVSKKKLSENIVKQLGISEDVTYYYGDGWMIMQPQEEVVLLNVETLEIITVTLSEDVWLSARGKGGCFTTWDRTAKTESLYVKGKLVASGYQEVEFTEMGIFCYKTDSSIDVFDYTGKKLCALDCELTDIVNGRMMLHDENGFYYVDVNFQRVGEYIYNGVYDDYNAGSIKIDGKWYLVAEK